MHYLLPLDNKYPIETEDQIKAASDYFNEKIGHFSPADRVQIAWNLEKRADDLGVNLNLDWVTNYARAKGDSESYSPDFESNMKLRKEACLSGKIKIKVGGKKVSGAKMVEKISSLKSIVHPKQMVNTIAEFDKEANLVYHYDKLIKDPVFTVYGSDRLPEYDAVKVASSLSNYDLKRASRDVAVITKLSSAFGDNFVTSFKSAPLETFQSMPLPERELILEKINE